VPDLVRKVAVTPRESCIANDERAANCSAGRWALSARDRHGVRDRRGRR